MYTHVLSYLLYHGPIRPGYDIDHVLELGCRFKDCINPDHLEAVSHSENMRRIKQRALQDPEIDPQDLL